MIVKDPWEEAFASYRQALVDINGDGVPDAAGPVPGRMSDAARRRATVAGIDPQEPAPGQQAGARARDAFQRAYENPSVGNVAYAGLQGALLGTQLPNPLLPLRYAIPAIGTDMAIDMAGGQANAQGAGVEARLQQMSPQELMIYQRNIGVAPDGRIGPQTVAAARRYEADQKARADQAAETDRIRAQGDADAARERSRILAQAEADAARAKSSSELSAQEAQRPFLQRNPGYSTYAPYVAGAAAAALPFAGALLSRRAATMPVRQQARTIDTAVEGFNAAPTPMAARTAANAASAPLAQPAAPSGLNSMLDYASMGVGASLPSAAVVAPYVIDYMQPPDTEAHKTAAQQFTVNKMLERMTGPFALGMAMAGGGRFLGEKAGSAFINPAPRAANMAQAQVLRDMVNQAPDDGVLTNYLANSLRGGQTTVLENKRLLGAINAEPPNVVFDDIGIGNVPTPLRNPPGTGGAPGGPSGRGLPSGGGDRSGHLPSGPSGGLPDGPPAPQPPAPLPPTPRNPPDPGPRSPSYGAEHSAVSRQYLDELLASGQPIPDAKEIRNALSQRYGDASLSRPTQSDLSRRINQTLPVLNGLEGAPPEVVQNMLAQIMGQRGFLALPAAAASAEPVNRLLQLYTGQETSY